jgi:hypothetical protein
MPVLEQYHQEDLKKIENILLARSDWPLVPKSERHRSRYPMFDYFPHFEGLRTILILWVPAGPEHSDDEEELEEDKKKNDMDETVEEYAERVKTDFLRFIAGEACTATTIRVLDREGNIY